jgi:hypothetical protein
VAIVTGGLGQPEEGALVVGGLGATETDPNALRATLGGSCTIVAVLTDGGTPAPAPPRTGGGGYYQPRPVPAKKKPRKRKPIPANAAAHLHGTSNVYARIDFTIDPDQLAYELTVALLLDLV